MEEQKLFLAINDVIGCELLSDATIVITLIAELHDI